MGTVGSHLPSGTSSDELTTETGMQTNTATSTRTPSHEKVAAKLGDDTKDKNLRSRPSNPRYARRDSFSEQLGHMRSRCVAASAVYSDGTLKHTFLAL